METNGSRVKVDRRIERPADEVFEYANLGSFLANPSISAGVHGIWYGGLPVDIDVTPAESKTLVVILHGAAPKPVRLPFLTGVGITTGLPVSRLLISDPSLYIGGGLNLAWYAGSRYQPELQSGLIAVVKKVADSVGAEHVILAGSSGGGFAVLVIGAEIPGSTALAVNPQTTIGRYARQPVMTWLDVAWGVDDISRLPATVRTSAAETYAAGTPNHVVYLQNARDIHVREHLAPFMEVANPRSFQLQFGDWGPGHARPPRDVLRRALENIISREPGAKMPGCVAFETVQQAARSPQLAGSR